jgi:hypothetical protein
LWRIDSERGKVADIGLQVVGNKNALTLINKYVLNIPLLWKGGKNSKNF